MANAINVGSPPLVEAVKSVGAVGLIVSNSVAPESSWVIAVDCCGCVSVVSIGGAVLVTVGGGGVGGGLLSVLLCAIVVAAALLDVLLLPLGDKRLTSLNVNGPGAQRLNQRDVRHHGGTGGPVDGAGHVKAAGGNGQRAGTGAKVHGTDDRA